MKSWIESHRIRATKGLRRRIFLTLVLLSPLAASASETYEYDLLGRLSKVTYSGGKEISYCYDAVGNRQVTIIADGASPPITNPACFVAPVPPPPPSVFAGDIVVVPLNGFTAILIP